MHLMIFSGLSYFFSALPFSNDLHYHNSFTRSAYHHTVLLLNIFVDQQINFFDLDALNFKVTMLRAGKNNA